MWNKAYLMGFLGADPETRYTQDGTCVATIRLATTERFKNRNGEQQERTEWHRVVLWGRLGEIASQYLKKGSGVFIEGKIETRKWTDRDGNERYTTEIRASEMKMLPSSGQRQNHAANGNGQQRPAPANGGHPQERTASSAQPADGFPGDFPGGEFDAPVDQDIPF